MKKTRTKVGDIFQVPINEKRCACGQVLLIDHIAFPLYVVVFKPTYEYDQLPDLEIVCGSEIALVGGTMDARIAHGYWTIIGNYSPVMDRIPKPYFKIDNDGKPIIQNFYSKFVRKATARDLDFYDNWWTLSPIAIEMAIKSIHGESDWLPAFDKLLIEYSLKRAE